MSNTRKGLITLLCGIFVYVAILPFAVGSHTHEGLIADMAQMYIPIRAKQDQPVFSDVTNEVEETMSTTVDVDKTNYSVEFASNYSVEEMKRVLRIRFNKGTPPAVHAMRLRFLGWTTSREPIDLPFRYVFEVSAFLVFGGLVIAVVPYHRSSKI